MFAHALAARLGKTLAEIGEISVEEARSWLAFFEWEKEQRERD